MIRSGGDPWELLTRLEAVDDHRALLAGKRAFAMACCRHLRSQLPEAAEAWLAVAAAYQRGQATTAEMIEARVAAWSFLGQRRAGHTDATEYAVRVLLGALWGDEELDPEREQADVQEGLYYAILFGGRAGLADRLLSQELEAAFPEFLDRPSDRA